MHDKLKNVQQWREEYEHSMRALTEYSLGGEDPLLRRFLCASTMTRIFRDHMGIPGHEAFDMATKAFNIDREEAAEGIESLRKAIENNLDEVNRVAAESCDLIKKNMSDFCNYQAMIIEERSQSYAS